MLERCSFPWLTTGVSNSEPGSKYVSDTYWRRKSASIQLTGWYTFYLVQCKRIVSSCETRSYTQNCSTPRSFDAEGLHFLPINRGVLFGFDFNTNGSPVVKIRIVLCSEGLRSPGSMQLTALQLEEEQENKNKCVPKGYLTLIDLFLYVVVCTTAD